ncbi:MAG TPA: methyltransferase domain-containing protein [Pseudomonas xinjiangensis]|uniref:Methyltransferase domain-containing protein n=2 Tax=root TaxID=1 RepID=A0A7V1BNV2_9GAMM|nr:methyltransferase domain-containing protein [Halopseudomonas xinjiangensis]HEC48739.1 methyltransferase domain-containing protein [Halopseudomonas xinjiangensis]
MQSCETPFGPLELERYPPTSNPTLQPFDTADLYLLQTLADQAGPGVSTLVVNDTFGTLGCALAAQKPHSFGDSHLAERALRTNLDLNNLSVDAVRCINSQEELAGPYHRVLLRVPKSLALLEDQLIRLRPHLAEGAQVIAGAMIKHLPHSAGDLLAKYIGPYQASLAWKKARLLTARFDSGLTPDATTPSTRYELPETSFQLTNLPGVFSQEKLDNGTRAMLSCIPFNQGEARIVDLGCGNGALGIMAAHRNPEASLLFIDESYAAIASAKLNFSAAFPDRRAEFLVSDGLIDAAPKSADLVLCNPPFHQLQVIGDEIAMRLFEQTGKALTPEGGLMIVGNRHLGYHVKLKRCFNKVEQIAANPKFVVLRGFN